MIIREIKSDTFSTIHTFDWFNDYNDTRRWLESQKETLLIELLDAGYKVWLKKCNEDFYKTRTNTKIDKLPYEVEAAITEAVFNRIGSNLEELNDIHQRVIRNVAGLWPKSSSK